MNPIFVIPALYALYFLYLLLAGAGLERTLKVLGGAAFYSGVFGAALGVVALLISAKAAWSTFIFTMMFASIVNLPAFTLLRARDVILPRSSALEVVCLNVLVMAIGRPPPSFPALDNFFQGAFHLLLNPFVSLMPASLGFAASFWPSVLALLLAARGGNASIGLRFFLNLWVQLMSIVWVLPTSIGTFRSFKGDSPLEYVEAISVCLGLVYVMMTWVLLHDSGFSKRIAVVDPSFNSPARLSVPRAFAAGMEPGRWSPFFIGVAGVCTYLLLSVLPPNFMNGQTAAAVGFVCVVAVSATLGQGAPGLADADDAPRTPWISWLFSSVFLVAILTAFGPVAKVNVAEKQRAADDLGIVDTRYPKPVTAIEALARPCELEDFGDYVLRCSRDTLVLEKVPHPAGIYIPAAVFAQDARDFALQFGERTLNCIEIPARIRDANSQFAETILLLIYVPKAVSALQFAWVVDIDATCRRVAELTTETRNGFGFLWHDATVPKRGGHRMGWLSDFPLAEPASGQEQRAQP